MPFQAQWLEVLRCPRDGGSLTWDEKGQRLINPRLALSYPVVDGVPVLLRDAARPLSGPVEVPPDSTPA